MRKMNISILLENWISLLIYHICEPSLVKQNIVTCERHCKVSGGAYRSNTQHISLKAL